MDGSASYKRASLIHFGIYYGRKKVLWNRSLDLPGLLSFRFRPTSREKTWSERVSSGNERIPLEPLHGQIIWSKAGAYPSAELWNRLLIPYSKYFMFCETYAWAQ